jgi:quercetin dioxygenase-like cupin family protein
MTKPSKIMRKQYTFLTNLAEEVDIPKDGIISRTLYSDDRIKTVMFGFSAGQELSEHTAAVPAIIHILQGEAELTLGKDTVKGQPGSWIHMPPKLSHSITATSDLSLLLILLKSPSS